MTAKQYLKLHPEKYILTGTHNGQTVYVMPSSLLGGVKTTHNRSDAEVWDSLSNTETKLSYMRAATKITDLAFQQCS